MSCIELRFLLHHIASILGFPAQVEALPRGAMVEVQPVAADPATSTAAQDTSDSDSEASVSPTAASSPSPGGLRMEGWIGHLQNWHERRELQTECGPLEVLTEALFSRGKLCRCHVSLVWGTAGGGLQSLEPAGAMSQAAPSQKGLLSADSVTNVISSVIESATAALQFAHVGVSSISSLKVYWRQQNPEAEGLALALEAATSQCAFSDRGVLVVPVSAVGSDAALTAFVHLEMLALAQC